MATAISDIFKCFSMPKSRRPTMSLGSCCWLTDGRWQES